MSKIVYLCCRHTFKGRYSASDIEEVSGKIIPDNIIPNPTEILFSDGIMYGIVNPVDTIEKVGNSVVMGQVFDGENWSECGSGAPEGSYAIFRSDDSVVELLSDVVSSRTIWYFKDEEIFMASTSQRALILLLRNFEFNEDVIPWVLSTGSLGPGNSWDRRIKVVPPDGILILDRAKWELQTHSEPVIFAGGSASEEQNSNILSSRLTTVFRSMRSNFDKWVLPLSGGFDSRSILCFLSQNQTLTKLRTVTWGIKEALYEKGNDAYVATKVAKHFNVAHKYYLSDVSGEALEKIFDRFLLCGEGRIDHLGGYADGFSVWKTLFEDGVKGILRGDECFGWVPVTTLHDARIRLGMGLLTDYTNLAFYKSLGIPEQKMPAEFDKRESESLQQWRDRLYQQFRVPVILSALNDLKLSYVEVINPLLSKSIIYSARQLPDHLREDKVLFKKLVNAISPPIEYATSGATVKMGDLLKSEEAVSLFRKEMLSSEGSQIFSEQYINHVLSNISVIHENKVPRFKNYGVAMLKRFLPAWLKSRLSVLRTPSKIDFNLLAFRSFIVIKMYKTFFSDTRSPKSIPDTYNSSWTIS